MKRIFEILWVLFEKSLNLSEFVKSTLTELNPGFGRPWNMLRKKFLIAIFIMLQKNSFGQKIFWILWSAFSAKMKNCHFDFWQLFFERPLWHHGQMTNSLWYSCQQAGFAVCSAPCLCKVQTANKHGTLCNFRCSSLTTKILQDFLHFLSPKN